MSSKSAPFYANGLYFSCTRCSLCCRHEPGYVFLSKKDVDLLAEGLKMQYTDIVKKFCRWIPSSGGKKRLSLREKPGYDCIFWEEGCTVYKYRPLQCRTFPFWESSLYFVDTWNALECPGTGKGILYNQEYIENCLIQRKAEPVITRGA